MASPFGRIAALCSVAVVLQSAGLVLFVLGFFPVKPALTGISGIQSFAPGCGMEEPEAFNYSRDRSNVEGFGLAPQFDRVVFMVIDGLPAEFVLGKDGGPQPVELMAAMPYTQNLLATGAAFGFHAKAASPTVTMPRLKAMTSGAIAGFLDVAYNFNTQALLEDNWIGQAARAGWRMVMLGDNTWLKLFPNLFERHDGVHSFFVKDTVEVDNNVTRHLDVELESKDWDLLVLHYLGLDHVGHLGGRSNPLMASKLREMDEVITRIHRTVLSGVCSDRRTLLVVLSDHGMTDSGNHGGATAQETDALALFVPGFGRNSSSPVFAEFPWKGRKSQAAYQVDVVPTMALLLGLPIPKNSVGALLPPLFSSLGTEQQIKALELNSWQLLRLLRARFPGSACIEEVCLNPQADKSDESLSTYKSNDELQGLCTFFRSALALQQERRQKLECTPSSSDPVDVPTFETVKEAYLDFLKHTSELLAQGSTEKRISFLLSGSSLMLTSTFLFMVSLLKTCKYISEELVLPSGQLIRQATPFFVKFIAIGGVCAHAASLGSSSFVEEEQYTWHFLVCTFMLALIRFSLQQVSKTGQETSLKDLGVTSKGTFAHVLQICLLLISGRTLRSWHRSGVNWTHLPDVAKWLDDGNPIFVSVIRIICVCSVTLLCCRMISKSLPKLLCAFVVGGLTFSAVVIFIYMRFTSTPTQDSRATLTARLGFGVLGITSLMVFFIVPWTIPLRTIRSIPFNPAVGKQSASEVPEIETLDMAVNVAMDATGRVLVSCWCLFQLLLQQPVNAGPIALLLLQLVLTLNLFRYCCPSHQQWIPNLSMHWLGASGHFGLGNSNTLATVDVAGAYIGLSSHSTMLSGILAFSITYGSPLLYMQALLLQKSPRSGAQECSSKISQLGLLESFALPVVLPLALNSIVVIVFTGVLVVMQNHLFVWSVFSPKYLYVCMTTVSLYIGTLVVVATEGYSILVLQKRLRWAIASVKLSKCD